MVLVTQACLYSLRSTEVTFCNRTITTKTVDSGSSMDWHDKATDSVHRPAVLVSVPNRLF